MREAHSPKAADLIAAYTKMASALVELADKKSRLYTTYHGTLREEARPAAIEIPWREEPFYGRQWALDAISHWLRFPVRR